LNDTDTGFDTKIYELADDFIAKKLDALPFRNLINLNEIKKDLLPYIEEISKLDMKIDANIALIFNSLLDKHLKSKKEQQIKEKLELIKDISKKIDSSKKIENQNNAVAFKEIEDVLNEIFFLIDDDNNLAN
jgi:hypothetical protein